MSEISVEIGDDGEPDLGSISDRLLRFLLDNERNLASEERLAVAECNGGQNAIGDRRYADLLLETGCFEEAGRVYEAIGHWRKAGDCYLALGWPEKAAELYARPASPQGRGVFRGGPDHDRLMGIAFRASDWAAVIETIRAAEPSPCDFNEKQIFFGGSTRAKGPVLRILITAAERIGRSDDIREEFALAFGVDQQEWSAVAASHAIPDAKLEKEQAKTFPRALRREPVSFEDALARGQAAGPPDIAAATAELPAVADALKAFLASGGRSELETVIGWLIGEGSYGSLQSRLHDLVNATMLHTSRSPHALAVYRAHPSIARAGMNHYLRALCAAEELPSGEDLYTGLLQHLSFDVQSEPLAPRDKQNLLRSRLARAQDWAATRLGQWFGERPASELFERVRVASRSNPWKDVRQLVEWSEIMRSAAAHLADAWAEEIGHVWQGEELAFRSLSDALPAIAFERHARPLWLAPQHLDIFASAICLAIEYMGEQHYRPVNYFGGEDGYRATRERDERKASLCNQAGVRLEYIRYDEDISERVREIVRPFVT